MPLSLNAWCIEFVVRPGCLLFLRAAPLAAGTRAAFQLCPVRNDLFKNEFSSHL